MIGFWVDESAGNYGFAAPPFEIFSADDVG